MSYLVTGSMGCIGAWTIKHLLEQDKRVISLDISDNRYRLDWLLERAEQSAATFVQGDLTNFSQLNRTIAEYGVRHIIHLAALQVPACRTNPALGAQVNVVGTVNLFEAARQNNIPHIAYASSIAVYGPADHYPSGLLASDAPKRPQTLYGVFKTANEGTADVYWRDHAISSTALRPYTVYGLGRDQGLTSEPTKAIRAAALGNDYSISFGGRMQFHFASDVARQFIVAAEHPLGGAAGFNLGTPPVAVAEFASLLMDQCPNVTVTVADQSLPFPDGTDAAPLHAAFNEVYETPLIDGIAQTLAHFKRLDGNSIENRRQRM